MSYQRRLQSKLGYQHNHFWNTSEFDGNIITPSVSTPSASVRAGIKIPDNWDIAYEQVPSASYYANTYVSREHIVLHPTTEIASGERSEMTFNAFDEDDLGVTVEYICYHMIKTGFTDDYPTNRFMLFQQWHQQSSGLSPENYLAYGRIDASTRVLQACFGNTVVTNPAQMVSLTLDQWVKVTTIAKWTPNSDGFARLYRNNILLYEYNGPTLTTENKIPYWKFGLYRNRAIDVEQAETTKWPSQRIIY